MRRRGWSVAGCGMLIGALWLIGCKSTPIDTSKYAVGPAPLREPSPATSQATTYEDSLNGGQVFAMYCGACHNARALAERPFSNYKNAAAHMRVRANMTGEEYAELMAWLRRWHNVAPPHPSVETTPKRFFFSQPINELREETPANSEKSADEPVPSP